MTRLRTAVLLPLALLAAGISLAGSGLATGGDDPLAPLPGTLDELLASALRRNPEILVEEARVREAQANLNQARLAVTQRVVVLHFERAEHQRVLGELSNELMRLRQLHAAGTASDAQVRESEIAIAQSEGALARIDAELRYSIGHGGTAPQTELLVDPRGAGSDAPPRSVTVLRAPVPEAISQRLDRTTVSVDFRETPLEEVLATLSQASGLEFLLGPSLRDSGTTVTLQLRSETSVRKVIHAIADTTEVVFVVREYGLLAVWDGEAPESAAVIPPPEE